jgi:hypothetical protein
MTLHEDVGCFSTSIATDVDKCSWLCVVGIQAGENRKLSQENRLPAYLAKVVQLFCTHS